MKIKWAFIFFTGCAAFATAQNVGARPSTQPQNGAPVYQVKMVGSTVTAVSYEHRSGKTPIGFEGTPLLAQANGNATVETKHGQLLISAEFKNLLPAQRFGKEYLTYVLWAITPEGKASNLGEVLLDGTKSKIEVTTPLQTFGLIVTAEPYFAVNQPSNAVILQNTVLPETRGTIEQVTAKYQTLERGQYSSDIALESTSGAKSNTPLELDEARNAVAIAKSVGAEQYAPDAFAKARDSLAEADTLEKHKGDKKQIVQNSRDAVQNAADARQIAISRIEDERAAQERADAARRTAQAQAEAAEASARQQQEEAAKEQAEIDQQKAELQAQQEAAARQQAQQQAQEEAAARVQAQQQAQQDQLAAAQAQQAAAQAQQAAAQAEQEKQALRATLLQQFNRILPTTDTPRGLKVNISDVLFATAKFDLREPAREALAKLSGIVLGHPGLKLEIDGYTDGTGSDEYNQTLSENRANSVRAYLVQQGLDPGSITAMGFGKANPVASNDTNQGRQMNRRVEIIVSGEIIGSQIGAAGQAAPAPAAQQQQQP